MSTQSGGRDSARRVSARNPRRRQRVDADSVGQQPRRKRSKVTSDTFDTLSIAGSELTRDTVTNGHAETRSRKSATPSEALDIPLRSRKSMLKRASRGDGGTRMTQTSQYALRQLPSTPDVIVRIPTDFHGSSLSSPSLALVVTRSHAYIWDYNTSNPSTQPRTFDVPYSLRPADPVPLGHLVTNGASSAVGLVLVSSVSGDVTFWENIDTAESLSLFQDRNIAVKGSIGGLFGGEAVTDITNAEHAGIILTLSSGRIAQVSLRDAQGKPQIQAQYLKSKDGSGGSGLLGSLRGVLGVGWKRDLIGVRTRSQGAKGQMQIISATASAQVQIWDLAWSGQCAHKDSIDFKDLLQSELGAPSGATPSKAQPPTIVDFDVLPTKSTGNEVSLLDGESPIDLVLLVQSQSTYSLVEVTISNSKAYVERITPVKGVTANRSDKKPHLLLPKPGDSAIVVLSRSIAVVSLAAEDTSGAEAQLLMEAHAPAKAFQDVIDLRNNDSIYVQDSGSEEPDERTSASNCMLFIHGFGLARLTVAPSSDSTAASVPIKSRLEQAIYFGTDSHNILDFHHIDRSAYGQEEVEQAAAAVSDEILSSENPFLSTSFTKLGDQIEARLQACRALIGYLQRHFAPVSKVLRWKLLTDAERLQAASKLWTTYQLAVDNPELPQPSVLPAVIKVIRGRSKGGRQSKTSELDEVRDWFLHDLSHLDQLVLQSLSLVNHGYRDPKIKDFLKLLSEANDVIFSVFGTVFAFRTEYASAYGFNPAIISDGILEESWEDLPEPWTATHELLNLFDQFIDITRNYTVEYYDARTESASPHDDLYVDKVVKDNVDLVATLCKCYRERIGWCSQHYSEKHRQYAPGLQDKFHRSRDHHLRGLIKIGQAGQGLDIAEKYKDMDSLVRLVMSETGYLSETLAEEGLQDDEKAVITLKMDDLQKKVEKYFREYGDAFGNAFFDSHLAGHRSFGLLEDQSTLKEPLTRYLRAEGARGRLGWINEVLNTKDLSRAQGALQNLAEEHETKLWNKKVEASLSKLTALASSEAQGPQIHHTTPAMKSLDANLEILQVQEIVYAHIAPTIAAAVDHEAEVQLVSDTFAVSLRSSSPALFKLLEVTFDDLLSNTALSPEQLIDVLTLMDSAPSPDSAVDIAGTEFHLALKVLAAVKDSMPNDRWQTLLRLVWKRCYLQDPWDLLNKTHSKSDRRLQEQVLMTVTCQTVALGLADVLSPGSAITVLKPEDCIGAGSTSEDLAHRFPTPDIRDPIVHDNAMQDVELQKHIDSHSIGKWVNACVEAAKKMVEEEATARLEEEQLADGIDGVDGADDGLRLSDPAVDIMEDDLNDSLDDIDAEQEQHTTAATSLADPADIGDAGEQEAVPKGRRGKANGVAHGAAAKGGVEEKENLGTLGRKSRRLRSQGRDLDGDVDMS